MKEAEKHATVYIEQIDTERIFCPACGHEIKAGEWPWCDHQPVTGPHPIIMERKP